MYPSSSPAVTCPVLSDPEHAFPVRRGCRRWRVEAVLGHGTVLEFLPSVAEDG